MLFSPLARADARRHHGAGSGPASVAVVVLLCGLLVACGAGKDGASGPSADVTADTGPADGLSGETAPQPDATTDDATAQPEVQFGLSFDYRLANPSGESDGLIKAQLSRTGDDGAYLEISAGGFVSVHSWTFRLRYDPAILHLEDVHLTDVLADLTALGKCVGKRIVPGEYAVACGRMLRYIDPQGNQAWGVRLTNDATFLTATFRIVGHGVSPIRFDECHSRARGGELEAIEPFWQGGTLEIERIATTGGRS